VAPGVAHDHELDVGDESVELLDQREIELDGLAHRGIGEVLEQAVAVGGVGDALAQGREVVLVDRVLDVSEELAALAHQVKAPAEQIAGRAHLGGVDVGLGEHAAAEQHGDLVGVDPVVLGLAAVDGLHGERVAEHEGDALGGAQIGEPVPGEGALGGDDEIVAVRRDEFEEHGRRRFHVAMDEHLALGPQDADVHRARVQIDPAVVAVLAGVESHGSSSCADARAGCRRPAYSRLEWAQEGAWMRITPLKMTAACGRRWAAATQRQVVGRLKTDHDP
jgi:hypothetical protein